MLDEEYAKEYQNKLTIGVPVQNRDEFYKVFMAYEQSEYIKRQIIYCFTDINNEEFLDLKLKLNLFQVPFINGELPTYTKMQLFYSETYPNTFILLQSKRNHVTFYNTITNIAEGSNLILTKVNVYLNDATLNQVNHNINLGFEIQTGFAISEKNLQDYQVDQQQIKVKINTIGTYKFIRQIEKLVYDKSEQITMGGFDNEFIIVNRETIKRLSGFTDQKYTIDEFALKLSKDYQVKQKLDYNLSAIYFRDEKQRAVNQVFDDKYKSVKLVKNNFFVKQNRYQLLNTLKYFGKKLLRFYNTYFNLYVIIFLVFSIINDLVLGIPFTIFKLITLLLAITNYVISIYLYFIQQERTGLKLDYVPTADIVLNVVNYVVFFQLLGFISIIISIIRNIVQRRSS